jgi:hypothetical protein
MLKMRKVAFWRVSQKIIYIFCYFCIYIPIFIHFILLVMTTVRMYQLEKKQKMINRKTTICSNVDVVQGVLEYIREHWFLPYSASFIFCPLRADGKIPTSVSLYGSEEVAQYMKNNPVNLPPAHNRVRVHRQPSPTQETSGDATLAACVKAIHYQFGKVLFHSLSIIIFN